jgi:glycosyltransferase involved in cell wall biosynthesis
MSRHVANQDIDFVLSASNFIVSTFCKNVIQVIHDVSPITHPENVNLVSRLKFRILLALAVRNAKKLVCISEYTKQELIKVFPLAKNKAGYIGVGLHEWTQSPKSSENQINNVLSKYHLEKPYFLSVSTLQPRKNYSRAIAGFNTFVQDNPTYTYAIAGKKGWFYEAIFSTVKELGLESTVHFLDYVPEADLPALYDGSAGLIFVSTEEGAGLPPLEALSRSKPVVLSDIPVHRETAGEDAIYVDPLSALSIAEGIKSALKADIGAVEILKKHTWENVASRLSFFFKEGTSG